MRAGRLRITLGLAAAALCLVAAATPTGSIKLANGDVAHGAPLAFDPAAGIVWELAGPGKGRVNFDPAQTREILLDGPDAAPGAFGSLVEFTNHDVLPARLLAFDGRRLAVKTAFAERLELDAKKVLALYPNGGDGYQVYSGPRGLDGWGPDPGWEYRGGAFYSTGQGGGQGEGGRLLSSFKLPPAAKVSFDLAWRGFLDFGVQLYTGKARSYLSDGFALGLGRGRVSLRRFSKASGMAYLGDIAYGELNGLERAKITILADTTKRKRVVLLVDGVTVKTWEDAGALGPGEELLAFHAQSRVKISDISVSAWAEASDAPDSPAVELLTFANGDQAAGRLLSIKDSAASFACGGEAPLDVPLERIAKIQFPQAGAQVARKLDGDARIVFRDLGSVTAKPLALKDGALLCESENFGEAAFKLDGVRKVEFNIYQADLFPERPTPVW